MVAERERVFNEDSDEQTYRLTYRLHHGRSDWLLRVVREDKTTTRFLNRTKWKRVDSIERTFDGFETPHTSVVADAIMEMEQELQNQDRETETLDTAFERLDR